MLTFLKSKKDRIDDAGIGSLGPSGTLSLEKITYPVIDGEMDLLDIAHYVRPHNGLSGEMNQWKVDNAININRGLVKIVKAMEYEIPTFWGTVWATKVDGLTKEEVDYGIISLRVITNAGVNYIKDAFVNGTIPVMNFHGIGTGGTAEATTQTALVTELTTEYGNSNTRCTGTGSSQATASGAGAQTATYRNVGTNTLDSGTPAITEHGLFSAATAGTMIDRSLFSAINLVGTNGDSLQTTYDLNLTSNG